MPRLSTTARRAAFYSFVEQFAEEFGRSERRQACAGYLTELLVGKKQIRRVQLRHSPDALRHFLGRSPWSHESVLHRLRILLKPTSSDTGGVLLFRELQIPRRGLDAVGCDRQELQSGSPRRPSHVHGNCQTFVIGFWVDKLAAWPIDVCLYLPFRCALRLRHLKQTGVPGFAQGYRTKGMIALNMLHKLSPDLGVHTPVLLGDSLTEDWNSMKQAVAQRMSVIGELHPLHPWPIPSDTTGTGKSRAEWGLNDVIRHTHSNQHRLARALRTARDKQGAIYEEITPTTLARATADNRDASLLFSMESGLTPKIYLRANSGSRKHSGATITQYFQRAQTCCEQLSNIGGIRRYEGKSWMGIHRHLTMCFMAEHYRIRAQLMP